MNNTPKYEYKRARNVCLIIYREEERSFERGIVGYIRLQNKEGIDKLNIIRKVCEDAIMQSGITNETF